MAEPRAASPSRRCNVGRGPGFLSVAGTLALLVAASLGCAAYRFGNGTLYAPDVETVFVPVVESDSFRPDLGERLTEAIQKEIELKTPFKVVGTPDADSILSTRILFDRKHVTVENQNDDPRAVEVNLVAETSWYNRRRQPLVPAAAIPVPLDLLPVGQTTPLIPEAGQSIATQQQQAIQRLAEQIVATMEEPW